MEISIENAGPYNSVRLYGQLDSQGAGSIYDAIVGLGSLGPGKVVVDMGSVTHATRAGCGALFVAAKLLHVRTGHKLFIYNTTCEIARLFESSGYNHMIQVHRRSRIQSAFAA
ncbi:MAG: STAS domain-containing protein [Pseudomonadota bacterium]